MVLKVSMANSSHIDRGNEFISKDFTKMSVNDYGIKRKPITVRNPQANAIVERIHQVIANMVRTFELETNYLDEDDPWKGILCYCLCSEINISYYLKENTWTT